MLMGSDNNSDKNNLPSVSASGKGSKVVIDLEAEKKEISKRYRHLLRACKSDLDKKDKKLIRLAFDTALEAHKEMRRKSGEPYIYHPIAVAQIVAEEIGLRSAIPVVCALLHDTVEDTYLTLEDIRDLFGPVAEKIIDGLTKIAGVFDHSSSLQAENFRKMLLTLSVDVRVILIKLADRLHNMRTLGSMARDKQLKIASETAYLYAPLAHRLGLYNVKTELDDLALKYTEPEVYKTLAEKLRDSKKERDKFISEFIHPIKDELNKQGFKFEIKGRPKSIHSIWEKMKKQGVTFEEIYDLFAIRIIIDSPQNQEKADCWKVYSIVTDSYRPNPDRLRDWISTPKSNGYEALHTTVMSDQGKWVEVQIRSQRMNETAEKGFAAHWKYKESSQESALDEWLTRIREMLENPDSNALDFVDDFKLNLFADEIFVFTPKGELKTLPVNSTALDFAYEIHTDIGSRCIGAKINHRLVPISHKLNSGDQVEILTSDKQRPKEDWLSFVITAKAKGRIKSSLKDEKRILGEQGKEIFDRKIKHLKIPVAEVNMNDILLYYKLPNVLELYYRIAMDAVDLKQLREAVNYKDQRVRSQRTEPTLEELVTQARGSSDMLVIGENLNKIDYKLSPCCNPIPGDDVFGFITINDGIKIHRVNCPNAMQLMSNYAYRIVKAKWTGQEQLSFLAGIKITGMDDVGVVNNITKVISSELKVNMRSISIESNEGLFEGTIMLFVHDTEHLTKLMKKLSALSGILNVTRIT
ncbi:MAG TPA: bifunctional (p)ppGpp synthetase/guanosine-3',5'-bis(diphosphate) 3'-pyrophosphohydrolase [Bacteroidia bacterium]|nr:bifunctional (p)ppGpp synthetase/guanosine-3',5'-bis(diphosphate) 3'-pyrophosphohydrolase [Bacteroidia bacterium]HQW49393.1 bifunctional (p)ppGpp synthetase/guanosine-3',5'-bis(diphosphate) 3'-pyrophosphohydrolase [Bacteroidia bacterium]HQZ77444.1 bifunctional (p)ppGpp synthetase/guanosine-3',5'-bis(diphosphate) 3'-pyrophosphohydrolase [Bacteroidia bacterium]HRB37920.1 bifunctional (p)ppGpp synthetase/guanosine-3',5'-bis(diphosphate) 3'-pyrophosphohydrolase [Bacteroidia bacterium]HRC35843.1 